ncbi:MAG: septum formation initiator family protein [bacterium]
MAQKKVRKKLTGKDILTFILILIIAIAFLKNGLAFISANVRINALKTEIEELKVKNTEIENKIKVIYSDKEYVETKAREELGMVKEGETVIKIKK